MRISLNAILVTSGVLLFATAIYLARDYPRFKTFFASKIEALRKAVSTDDNTPSKVISLEVSGMTCGGCEARVRNALTKLQGVKKVEVSYKRSFATVTVDPQKVDTQVLIDAVTKVGYIAVQKSP